MTFKNKTKQKNGPKMGSFALWTTNQYLVTASPSPIRKVTLPEMILSFLSLITLSHPLSAYKIFGFGTATWNSFLLAQ